MSLAFEENAIESFDIESGVPGNVTSVTVDLSNASGTTDGNSGFLIVFGSFDTNADVDTTMRATFKSSVVQITENYSDSLPLEGISGCRYPGGISVAGAPTASATNFPVSHDNYDTGGANTGNFDGERTNFMFQISINGQGTSSSEANGYAHLSGTYAMTDSANTLRMYFPDLRIFQDDSDNKIKFLTLALDGATFNNFMIKVFKLGAMNG